MLKRYFNTVSAFQFYQLARYTTFILIGVVFTKTTLTTAAIGEYETFIFLSGAVSFFWLNGLLKAMLPMSKQESTQQTSIFSVFVVIQAFSILAALLLLFLHPFFSKYLLNGKIIPETGLIMVFILLGVPASLVEYYYLIRKRNHSIVFYAIVSFSVQFVLVVLPPVLGYGISSALKGLVASSVLRYLWLWGIFIFHQEISLSVVFIRKFLKLGGPLVTATLLSGSAQFVDGFIVTSRFDEATFAVFRYGARELPLAMLLANALSSAMLPEFAEQGKLQQNLEKLKKNVTRLIQILFPLTIIILLVSHLLFPVVFSPEFKASATVFNIYLLVIISRLLMPQTILNGLQRSGEIMRASFFELVLNITLSLVLVNYLGIAGVAFATFLAYLFEKIYLGAALKLKFNVKPSDYIPVRTYVLYSAVTMILFIFVEYVF